MVTTGLIANIVITITFMSLLHFYLARLLDKLCSKRNQDEMEIGISNRKSVLHSSLKSFST